MSVQPIVYRFSPFVEPVTSFSTQEVKRATDDDVVQLNNIDFPELNQSGVVSEPFVTVTESTFDHFFDYIFKQNVEKVRPLDVSVGENYVEVQEGVDYEMLLWNLRERLMVLTQREMSNVFAQLIHQVSHVIELNEGMPRNRTGYIPNSVIAISHLSLPEALLYYELSKNEWSKTPFFMSMFVTKKPSPGHPYIEMSMYMRQYPCREKRWVLRYYVDDLACDIFEESKKVGHVKFVIRNRKLEEIDGTYKNEKLVLDPVWRGDVGKRVDLKEEHVQFGGTRATLVYDHMSEFGVWRDNHGTANQLSMDDIEYNAKTRNVWITAKKVRFNKFQLNMKFVFGKGILTPVTGFVTGSGI